MNFKKWQFADQGRCTHTLGGRFSTLQIIDSGPIPAAVINTRKHNNTTGTQPNDDRS